MNIIIPRVISLRTFLIYVSFLLMVQPSFGIAVVGNISVQQGLVDGAAVHTIVDGRRLDIHSVDNMGKYKIELAYNHKYELIFAQKGSFSQKIVIETLVPDEVLQSNPKFSPFSLDINLYPEVPGISKWFVENPIRKIYYNPTRNNFTSEIYFDDNQIAKQFEVAVFRSQFIARETDFLSKLTRVELAEMKREYDKILDWEEIVNEKGPVFAVLDGYMDSNSMVTKEEFRNFRNNEIHDLLGAIIIAAELDNEQSERFDEFIMEADNLLVQKKYTSARIFYNRALSINPNDDYAKMQTEIISELLEEQVEVEKYNNIIAHADNSFNELLFSAAAKEYQVALSIKPYESYPKSKLEKINSILNKELIDAKKKGSYNQSIKEAEAMYYKQFYEKSLASYIYALNLEPGDKLASLKIVQLESEMTKLADKLMYDKLIVSANKLYKKEQYEEAIKEYFAAIDIIPDDKYAFNQINIINKKLILEEYFTEYITKANIQFEALQYNESRENYLLALEINSKDKYSRNRVNEIDLILATEDAEQKYNLSLTQADQMFNTYDYENATAKYLEASRIKPKEKYPKEKLKEIDGETSLNADNFANEKNGETALLNNELEVSELVNDAELQNIYNQYINTAEELFNANNYADSRKWYYKAWDVKPDENKPKQQIDNINELLKSIWTSPIEREYQQFVDLADSTFRNNQYAVARGWYNRALTVKANETYPKDQLNEIDKKITERMAAQSGQQFENEVQKASAAFDAKNYNVARFWYKKALELRPDNIEVKTKLKEIDAALN